MLLRGGQKKFLLKTKGLCDFANIRWILTFLVSIISHEFYCYCTRSFLPSAFTNVAAINTKLLTREFEEAIGKSPCIIIVQKNTEPRLFLVSVILMRKVRGCWDKPVFRVPLKLRWRKRLPGNCTIYIQRVLGLRFLQRKPLGPWNVGPIRAQYYSSCKVPENCWFL